jgi:hypothetical protein
MPTIGKQSPIGPQSSYKTSWPSLQQWGFTSTGEAKPLYVAGVALVDVCKAIALVLGLVFFLFATWHMCAVYFSAWGRASSRVAAFADIHRRSCEGPRSSSGNMEACVEVWRTASAYPSQIALEETWEHFLSHLLPYEWCARTGLCSMFAAYIAFWVPPVALVATCVALYFALRTQAVRQPLARARKIADKAPLPTKAE